MTSRCLTTTTTTTPSTTSLVTTTTTRKRSRKPKSIRTSRPYPITTRERVRWLQDRNQILNDNYYFYRKLDRRVEDLTNTAEQRILWLRHKFFSFWGDDINDNDNKKNTDGSSNNSGDDDYDDRQHRRHPRAGPIMDGKWWFWNILFALMPAFLLFCYFQFVVEPEMREFNRFLHIVEQEEKWGDLYKPEKDEELARMIQEEIFFTTKLFNSLQELFLYFFRNEVPKTVGSELRLQSPGATAANIDKETVLPPTEGQDNNDNASTKNEPTVKESLPSITATAAKDEDPTIAELKARIQQLEKMMNTSNQETVGIKIYEEHPSTKQLSAMRAETFEERREMRKSGMNLRSIAKQRQREAARNRPWFLRRMYESSKEFYHNNVGVLLPQLQQEPPTSKEKEEEERANGNVAEMASEERVDDDEEEEERPDEEQAATRGVGHQSHFEESVQLVGKPNQATQHLPSSNKDEAEGDERTAQMADEEKSSEKMRKGWWSTFWPF